LISATQLRENEEATVTGTPWFMGSTVVCAGFGDLLFLCSTIMITHG